MLYYVRQIEQSLWSCRGVGLGFCEAASSFEVVNKRIKLLVIALLCDECVVPRHVAVVLPGGAPQPLL